MAIVNEMVLRIKENLVNNSKMLFMEASILPYIPLWYGIKIKQNVERKQEKYRIFNYVIRAKLFKGLKDQTMNMRSIFDDEKIKLQMGQICNYCGSDEKLALDHIFPQKLGGKDNAENLIYACRHCNSSKGKKDLMEWMDSKGVFLPLMIIRRYLKLVFKYCSENEMLDKTIAEMKNIEVPFNVDFIPTKYPSPNELVMNIEYTKG
jgi:hypothetical protein